ncbi:MAG: TonB-dependent receptor [Sphingobacteriales bacterium]|nr:MAG: TonB-dependent receptor [Sphingobacteriales bacterium]
MKYLFTFFLILIYFSAQAQNSILGKIKDKKTGENIAGATLYIADLKRLAKTDLEGNYSFNNIPQGNFLLEIHAFTYSAENRNITVSGNTVLDILLEETHTELNEVVITGNSRATALSKSSVPVSIVNKKQLLVTQSNNLIDALSHVPGVQTISTGAAISKPVIRGLGYNRIITLYDGMRQEGQQWGDEHGIEIDEYAVDRIEILKGPASLMYGSDGLAGVINILSAKPLPEGKTEGKIFLNYQSNNNLLGSSVNLAGNHKNIFWDGRISEKSAGSYKNKYDGYVFNSAYNEWNASGGIGVNRSWGYSHISASTFKQNIGLPEGERDSLGNFITQNFINDTTLEERQATKTQLRSRKLFFPQQQIMHSRVLLTNSFLVGNGRVSANIGFQENNRLEFEQPEIQSAPIEPVLFMKLRTLNYDLKYFLPEKKGFNTSIGINGMYQQNTNKATEFIIPDCTLADGGIYGYSKKSFGRLDVSAGLRLDLRQLKSKNLYLDSSENVTTEGDPDKILKFDALDLTFKNISGSLGATYSLNKNAVVKANIARGFRSPNIAELSANGVHEGTFRYEIGNINLKPETSLQSDLGLNLNTKHFNLETGVFYNQIQHYIFTSKLLAKNGGDSFPIIDLPAPAYFYTQGNAGLYGGEIMMDIHPHPFDWLHFQNSFSYVRGKLLNQPDSLINLPFMPPSVLQSELRATRKKLGNFLRNASFEIELDHYFAQNKILSAYETETATPSYNLLNAGFNAEIINKKGKQLATIYILAGNITNTAYQHHLSRLKYAPENSFTGRTGIYNMGRNFSIKLEIPLLQ